MNDLLLIVLSIGSFALNVFMLLLALHLWSFVTRHVIKIDVSVYKRIPYRPIRYYNNNDMVGAQYRLQGL